MGRSRLRVYYSGRVQGVGFRYSVRQTATGFAVTGTVRNLPDGRVELVAEGERDELALFQEAIRESDAGGFIRQEQAAWEAATGEHRGFVIAH